MTRTKYDKEFKQTILSILSIENPKSVEDICKEYALKKATVYRWLKEFKSKTGAFKDEASLAIEKELRVLKKELKDTKEERDILKKAISIFSVNDKQGIILLRTTQKPLLSRRCVNT